MSVTNPQQKEFNWATVRNMMMFPKVVIPITAGREKSIKLLEEAQKNGQLIGILSQKLSQQENPTEKDLYQIGTIAGFLYERLD